MSDQWQSAGALVPWVSGTPLLGMFSSGGRCDNCKISPVYEFISLCLNNLHIKTLTGFIGLVTSIFDWLMHVCSATTECRVDSTSLLVY